MCGDPHAELPCTSITPTRAASHEKHHPQGCGAARILAASSRSRASACAAVARAYFQAEVGMLFRVTGTNRDTNAPMVLEIDAVSRGAAEIKAQARGMVVTSID